MRVNVGNRSCHSLIHRWTISEAMLQSPIVTIASAEYLLQIVTIIVPIRLRKEFLDKEPIWWHGT